MVLSYNGCRIIIEDSLIKCSYDGHYDKEYWQIILNDTDICYSNKGKKQDCFSVKDIREFQFEMANGALKYGDIPAAVAYLILKDDPDPKSFFHFSVMEEYGLLNQTKAHEFCNTILNYIGKRYGIPVAYKLSIDTKQKQMGMAYVVLIVVLSILLLWLQRYF